LAAADASPRHKQTSNDARCQKDLQIEARKEAGKFSAIESISNACG
jgi:hypothetical protein